MKLANWKDHADQVRWDAYKAFHITLGTNYYEQPFVQFDTGELIVRTGYLRPQFRRYYEELHVSLFQADDISYKKHLEPLRKGLRDPDGEIVYPSQLKRGFAPLMLWDHDTDRIVTCNFRVREELVLPHRFKNVAYAYFAGEGAAPIGATTRITKPALKTREEKQLIAQLRAACRAWYGLSDEGKEFEKSNWYPHKPVPNEKALTTAFVDMTPDMRIRMATWGTAPDKETRQVAYLTVAKS